MALQLLSSFITYSDRDAWSRKSKPRKTVIHPLIYCIKFMTLDFSSNPDSITYYLTSPEALSLSKLPLIQLCWLKEAQRAKPSAGGLAYVAVNPWCNSTHTITSYVSVTPGMCFHHNTDDTFLCFVLKMSLQTVSSMRQDSLYIFNTKPAHRHTHSPCGWQMFAEQTRDWMNSLCDYFLSLFLYNSD